MGNSVPRFTIPEDAVAIASMTHSGTSNFAVWTVDSLGSETDLLVNIIGGYSGTVLFDERDHSVAFSVETDGPWSITIRPVQMAYAWNPTTALSGLGDDVVLVDPATDGLAVTTISHTGSSNFVVWAFSTAAGQELLVNEIGAYSGDSLLADGTILFEVGADGSWSMTPPS